MRGLTLESGRKRIETTPPFSLRTLVSAQSDRDFEVLICFNYAK